VLGSILPSYVSINRIKIVRNVEVHQIIPQRVELWYAEDFEWKDTGSPKKQAQKGSES
jgi:DNA phosphorothioation-dependent restriction protein DptG